MTMEALAANNLDAPEKKAKASDDSHAEILAQAIKDFQRCDERERDNRADYQSDVRFARLGEQWDAKLKAQRIRDGRPVLTINKLPTFIRQVVNDARQNKPSIKVLPQDSNADPKTAEIYSGLIRNIEASSDADVAYDTALECAATGGFGYFRINLAYAHDETWDQDIVFEAVPDPLRVYGDPDSDAADSADWNIAFVTEMLTNDEFKKRWPDAQAVDFSAATFPDGWYDDGTDRIMVAEYWTRVEEQRLITLLSNGQVVGVAEYEANTAAYQAQGVFPQGRPRPVPCYKVTQYILTGTEVLSTTEWSGKFIPIVPVFGETVVLEGKRHLRSLIRDAKDAQIMYNVWRTVSTETVAMAPKTRWIGRKGTFDHDADRWATMNTGNHAFVEFDSEKPEMIPAPSVPQGAMQEALNASDDMKSMVGIFDAGVGARSNETSGVAIRARVKESDTSTFHFIDNLSRSIRHAGRVIIDLIPKVYSAGRVIRILGEDGTPETVGVGTPEEAQQAQQLAQVAAKEQGERIQAIYALGTGRYDLTVTVGPSFNTRREEAATQMIEAARAFPGLFEVAGDIIAKSLDWQGADEIAQRLAARMQQGQQPPQGAQQQPDPAAMAKVQLEQFEAQTDARQGDEKLRIDGFNAETNRLKAVHTIQQPMGLPRMPGFPG